MPLPTDPPPPSEIPPAGVGDLAAALRPAWVDVDLDALTANLGVIRRRTPGMHMLAVVKADAYGHGAVGVSRALEAAGVDWLGVALLEEGAELRRAGLQLPILVLGTARPAKMSLYRRYRLTPTISSLSELALWREWATSLGEPQPVHLKVDTGMSRLGVALDEVPEALAALRAHPRLRLAGFLSHFADADDLTSPRNADQEARFRTVLELLTEAERQGIEIHMANSAAALHHPGSRFTLARVGIALYGVDPVERGEKLAPVMSVVARIVQVREVPAGTPLSYGGRSVTRRRSRIAVVPVGYADGYAWRLTGKAEVLLRGNRVPVAGSVTMDMTLLDITETGGEVGEEVVLLGRQGAHEIPAAELARLAGTISWEVLCHLGLRLPRRYLRRGRVEEMATRFSR
ncbi:MAG TPA: alanine racemase [Thermoanaerobaculia bacterium]|nr:alanine racemase [Thermoanaerobaculia bacterium]